MTGPRIPSATYRLQFHKRFRFENARGLVPYLEALGITDLYASPILQARRGSTHGYDVTDPTRLNADLGAEAHFDALVKTLRERGMGLLLDIVPNHMAASVENAWWTDVLESGPGSPFAAFFDIDWHSPKKALQSKVLLPILGGPYGRTVEEQELSLRLEKGGFTVHCHSVKLPVSILSYPRILSLRLPSLEETYGPDHPSFRELWDLITSIEHLPKAAAADGETARERYLAEEGIKARLLRLYTERHEIRGHIDETLRIVNGRKGDPGSFDHLDRILSEQHYWLSFWRLANEEINYRRFFAVSELVSLRVEDPRVFDAAHERVLRLASEGKITGLRVDHVDGLYDPHGYLVRLMQRLTGSESDSPPADFYVLVEKILGEEEALPPEWPVHGTTGYDFLNALNGVFVSARGLKTLDDVYARFTGSAPDFRETSYRSKKLIMDTLFAGEMHSLGQHLGRLAEQDRYARDLPRKELRAALVEVTACFPVYRTYARNHELSPRDIRHIAKALKWAQQRGTEVSAPVFDFLRRVLLLEIPPSLPGAEKEEWLRFLMRWQQFTGPIMAKGVEDTSLYIHNRLVSMNEVGGNPASAGVPVNAFHNRCGTAAGRWPHAMNASSTHDTKRSEDVRARINVLSEIPEEWEAHLTRWSGWNAGKKRVVNGIRVPDPAEEILVYQTLLGAWPLEEEEIPGLSARIESYMVKALREAKVHTRWIRPNPQHESAVREFVSSLLEDPSPDTNAFLADFLPFQRKVAHYGAINGLAQLLVKIAAPGVPDIYQGTETWDFSLVDPDNRRAVDFGKRNGLLNQLLTREQQGQSALAEELLSSWRDGRIKLYVTCKALNFRRERKELFRDGAYLPLPVAGGHREHALAFARGKGESWAIAAVPRLSTRLAPDGGFPLGETAWGARTVLRLPADLPGRWRNAFTGEMLQAAETGGEKILHLQEVFRLFPVALLESA
ncbi:MAG: malto-oligosyltrehalose synthase [Deltaproteobacteria bacterium]|nr:malto-oligosyltrehalose synthase [Deltaproteobacteria bacterium]